MKSSSLLAAVLCITPLAFACAAPPPPEPKPAVELPVFADGPAKARNASYQSEKFDAWLDSKYRLFIQPKDDGKAVGGLFYVTTSCTFLLIDKQSWRDVVKLVKTPAPSQQAAKVEVAGEYEDGVDFTHTYEFSPAGVSVLATIKDPQNEKLKKRPSNLTLIAHFPAVPGVLSTMPSDKIAEMTAGCSLRVAKIGERAFTTLPYPSPIQTPIRPVERTESAGLWGPRTVSISMPPTKERSHPAIYATGVAYSYFKFPYLGYNVGRNIFSREKDKKIVIQVN